MQIWWGRAKRREWRPRARRGFANRRGRSVPSPVWAPGAMPPEKFCNFSSRAYQYIIGAFWGRFALGLLPPSPPRNRRLFRTWLQRLRGVPKSVTDSDWCQVTSTLKGLSASDHEAWPSRRLQPPLTVSDQYSHLYSWCRDILNDSPWDYSRHCHVSIMWLNLTEFSASL